MKAFLKTVCEGGRLSRAEAERAMGELLEGTAPPEQIAAFLGALQARGETADELLGFVAAVRARATPVPIAGDGLIDTCGTGGDGAGTFIISTASAFVLAAGGVGVAKHGNRSASSQSGSADVLEALGIRMETDPAVVAESIRRHGYGFFFAPHFHPVLARVSSIRKALGVRTVFNLIGPLVNPARAQYQVLGVFRADLLELFATVLRESGTRSAMIIRSEDGLDEFSLASPTRGLRLLDGRIEPFSATPEDFGLPRASLETLKGGLPVENARIIEAVLGGRKGPARDVVVMNSAAGFVVAGKAADFLQGAQIAAEVIDSGRATGLLAKLREAFE